MRKFVVFGYAASVLVIVILGCGLYRITASARAASALVDHTMQVLSGVVGVNASLARAESAHRGYLLYGDAMFLAQRDRELENARHYASGVAVLTVDSESQHRRATEFSGLLDERVRLMMAATAARDRGQAAPESRNAGAQLTARLYEVTEAMEAEERQLLEQRKAGEERDFDLIRYALLGSALVLVGIMAAGWRLSVREAGRRVRAERSVAELAESLPGAVFQQRVFPDGRIRYELLSSATEKVRGVNREDALRDPELLLGTIDESDRQRFMATIAEHTRSLTPLSIDIRCHVNGSARWIRGTAAPRRDDDGSVLWSGHWDDVTTQHELESQLVRSKEAADEANRAKSTFLATMSHEIRTPMNGVLGMLELLSLTKLDDEQRGALDVIRESGNSLLRIIDDILDFSKIEAGKLELVLQPTSLREVVEAVWNTYGGLASRKGLLLTRSVDPRLSAAVMADRVRLQQILGNFVSNAIKFTTTGGAAITAERLDHKDRRETVQFTVSDSGIGLSEEQQAKLFQPFTQAHGEVATLYGGTGLGLAISRRIAAMMGGNIRLESEPGTGTKIILTVPLDVVEGTAAQSSSAPPARATFVTPRTPPTVAEAETQCRLVLVVDDHPINRMVLLRQVNALGYAGETATDGRDAMDKWDSGRFACIIADCNMPQMNGYELAGAIRARETDEARPRTVIIACTANALRGEADKCLDAGMDDYLAKPVTLEHLAEKLAQWLPLPTTQAPTPVDVAMISDISGGDRALRDALLWKFRELNAEDVAGLRRAAGGNDMDELVMRAHRMKGASRTIGASALADACDEIERAAHARQLDDVRRHLPAFEDELRRLDAYIAELSTT